MVLATQAQSAGAQAQVFAGEIRAREQVNLSFRVPGKVAQRYVDDGARVKAGQVLARLDDQDLSLQNQASEASVKALKADLDLADSELRRYRGLVDKQLVSKSLYDSKQAQAQAAQARYQQARGTGQSEYQPNRLCGHPRAGAGRHQPALHRGRTGGFRRSAGVCLRR